MTKAARTPPPGSSFELYARAMLDHWLGKKVTVEFERDDGYRSGSKIDSYFTPPSKWPRMEREAIRLVRGRVLDLGCGPGRHSLFLQRKGFDVVGDWFDRLLVPPEELARLADETGWDLERVIWEGGYQPGDYVGVLGRR